MLIKFDSSRTIKALWLWLNLWTSWHECFLILKGALIRSFTFLSKGSFLPHTCVSSHLFTLLFKEKLRVFLNWKDEVRCWCKSNENRFLLQIVSWTFKDECFLLLHEVCGVFTGLVQIFIIPLPLVNKVFIFYSNLKVDGFVTH